MAKEAVIHMRVSEKQKREIEDHAKKNGFVKTNGDADITKYVLTTLEEKAAPKINLDEIKEEIRQDVLAGLGPAIRQELLTDKTLLGEPLKNIGIEYFVKPQSHE